MRKYIVFEGIVGCGKSTMINKTNEWLKSEGLRVKTMEEPGDAIRGILGTYGIDDRIDTLLFVADRLIQQKNLKKLEEDTILLSERCFLSTIAYQKSILPGNLLDLHDMHYKIEDVDMILDSDTFIFPDIVIILDVNIDEGMKRKKEKFEKWETKDYLVTVRDKYKQMTIDKKYPFEIFMINTDGSIEETFLNVKKIIKHALES
ncbi:MAG: dTMP kinase [Candidatus Helarchaeota archaeon]